MKLTNVTVAPNYLISDTGRVFSLPNKTRTGRRELKLSSDKYGYKIVTLQVNRQGRTFKVHRLVAEAFIPNPLNKPTVNHIDEDKTNNRVSNLEWATHLENNHHSLSGRYRRMRGETAICASGLTNEDVRDIRLFCEKGIPQKAIAGVYKVSLHTVQRIKARETWAHI